MSSSVLSVLQSFRLVSPRAIYRILGARVFSFAVAATAATFVLLASWLRLRRRASLAFPTPPAKGYHYIIVGAGSSGCTLASRLSEDPSVHVLLIEAGGDSRGESNISVPIASGEVQLTPYDWQFKTTPQRGTNGRVHNWPRGKCLGGSSCLNFMIYIRGNAADYDLWERAGCAGWGGADVLPFFKRSENRIACGTAQKPPSGADPAYHGVGGELDVSDPLDRNVLSQAFIDAATQTGHPHNEDFNGACQLGAGPYQHTITHSDRVRCSTAHAFLSDEVRSRSNLTILSHAHATRVLMDQSKTAKGVEVAIGLDPKRKRRVTEVYCRREVILCCGAVGTPHLMMLSGLGPSEHIGSFGIPVVCDLPGVGSGMQDHLSAMITHRVRSPVTLDRDITKTLWNTGKYILTRKGPFTTSSVETGAFLRTKVCDLPYPLPDIQLHFIPASPMSEKVGENFGMDMERKDKPTYGMTGLITLLHPKSEGTIRLETANPFDAPLVDPNCLGDERDLVSLVEGLKEYRKIASSEAFSPFGTREYILKEIASEHPPETDEYLEDLVRAWAITTYHPTGTARMGPEEDRMSVVDARLRVKGVKGLRVADCSIMPEIVSGNTNAPAIMIGEKAASMIVEDWTMWKREKHEWRTHTWKQRLERHQSAL